MNSKISVIMPAYNRGDMIGESIESVLSQTYDNWEILIVDSDSTDNTSEVCKSFTDKDSRIRYIKKSNEGVSASRNSAIDNAQGDYLFFLDSDDVIHPKLFEVLLSAMEESGATMGGSPVRFINQCNWHKLKGYLEKNKETGQTRCLTHAETLKEVFTGTSPINLIGGVMISRKLVADTRFNTDLHIGEDFYFMYENLFKGSDAVFLKEMWYYARLHGNNLSCDYSFEGFWSRFYRRKLVWQSEESAGRVKYANLQKLDGLNVYKAYLIRNNHKTPDGRKIRKTMKDYRKVIYPVLPFKEKVNFNLSVYTPAFYKFIFKVTSKIKRGRK